MSSKVRLIKVRLIKVRLRNVRLRLKDSVFPRSAIGRKVALMRQRIPTFSSYYVDKGRIKVIPQLSITLKNRGLG